MTKILFEGKELERMVKEDRTVQLFGGIFQLHPEKDEVITPVKLLFAEKLPKLLEQLEAGDITPHHILTYYIDNNPFMHRYFPLEAEEVRQVVNELYKDSGFSFN